jgi:osmotically-inducible protein OsmY
MKAVETRLKESAVEVSELTVAANAAGAVVISGIAKSPEERLRVTDIVKSVPGVVTLINSLLVIS